MIFLHEIERHQVWNGHVGAVALEINAADHHPPSELEALTVRVDEAVPKRRIHHTVAVAIGSDVDIGQKVPAIFRDIHSPGYIPDCRIRSDHQINFPLGQQREVGRLKKKAHARKNREQAQIHPNARLARVNSGIIVAQKSARPKTIGNSKVVTSDHLSRDRLAIEAKAGRRFTVINEWKIGFSLLIDPPTERLFREQNESASPI